MRTFELVFREVPPAWVVGRFVGASRNPVSTTDYYPHQFQQALRAGLEWIGVALNIVEEEERRGDGGNRATVARALSRACKYCDHCRMTLDIATAWDCKCHLYPNPITVKEDHFCSFFRPKVGGV